MLNEAIKEVSDFSYRLVPYSETKTMVIRCSGFISLRDFLRLLRSLSIFDLGKEKLNQLFDFTNTDLSDISVSQFEIVQAYMEKIMGQHPPVKKIALYSNDPVAYSRVLVFRGMCYGTRLPEIQLFNNIVEAKHWLASTD
ncbi:hypothetical protein [Pleionea sediminis]|uniref:hypothetical protein n=1 Tax=Pleionea sediminis TaxID=2569479 RepID=UPI001184FFCE|nr:hypothetical protein [Pleionea sediminis]